MAEIWSARYVAKQSTIPVSASLAPMDSWALFPRRLMHLGKKLCGLLIDADSWRDRERKAGETGCLGISKPREEFLPTTKVTYGAQYTSSRQETRGAGS